MYRDPLDLKIKLEQIIKNKFVHISLSKSVVSFLGCVQTKPGLFLLKTFLYYIMIHIYCYAFWAGTIKPLPSLLSFQIQCKKQIPNSDAKVSFTRKVHVVDQM